MSSQRLLLHSFVDVAGQKREVLRVEDEEIRPCDRVRRRFGKLNLLCDGVKQSSVTPSEVNASAMLY